MKNQKESQPLEKENQPPKSHQSETGCQNSPTHQKKISFSEFKTWNECPYRHKLIYLDGIPHFSGNEYTAFGTAIHEACEQKIPNIEVDAYQVFLRSFESELQTLKEEGHKENTALVEQMRSQAKPICESVLPAIKSHFGSDFEVFSVEESLMEPIIDFDSNGRNFKGFIDLVIKTKDGKYHVIDWKTCSWGWDSRRKAEKITNYQLIMYKHYFSQKHNIKKEDIDVYFALLKRTAKKNNVEIFKITSGPKKTNNCLSLLEKAVINIDRSISIKNRLSCKYCKFYKTEYCQ